MKKMKAMLTFLLVTTLLTSCMNTNHNAVTRAIVGFYGEAKAPMATAAEPIVVYAQIPFEEGTLVLAEKVTDGEHYPDLHFIDNNGKVTYLTRGSYCWTLNYTQFKGYNIFFGLAGVEKRATTQNPITVNKPVKKVEALFSDETESGIPAENIIAHVNLKENDTRIFKDPQGYILPVKGRKMPDDKETGQNSFTLIGTNEKRQIMLPKERGDYLFVLRTEKETGIQTYTGV